MSDRPALNQQCLPPHDVSPLKLPLKRNFGKQVIFLLETSQKGVLNLRQVCTLESAAGLNPEVSIILVFSDLEQISSKDNPAMMELLENSPNVKIATLSSSEAFKGTPFEGIDYRMLKNSSDFKVHSSDLLRLSLLWKFGGMYMDLDYITLRSLSLLLRLKNFLTADAEYNINNSMLGFERHNPFLWKILEHLQKNFNPEIYTTAVASINAAVRETFKIDIQEAIRRVEIDKQLYVLNYLVTSPVKYVDCFQVYAGACSPRGTEGNGASIKEFLR
ncbi:alpha-1,4-N-acetylglucosaminyltransferase-like isoform X2 [Neocloeon triangulifer]|uniref:alpha-1,4-N-acetylglucosaminyltransferase-like isoform X2 n=1 Tax=Neocloeon triangulifer TaxID=2078957 RepID=UPI00286FA996|nr:alpha-1,4-N-acetylglucosaminyltransferase-like isoform X2 [Neocloeon triangulifer]